MLKVKSSLEKKHPFKYSEVTLLKADNDHINSKTTL